jgi:hypothetical protein
VNHFEIPSSVTFNGTTHTTTKKIRLPRDWDQTAVKAVVGLVLALTGIAVVWSTVSIGAVLHGGVGYAAAVLFDLAWIINILLEWLSRFDARKRRFPRAMGWGLLLITMGAIFWHGMISHSVPLAVVGAAISMVAKVLWMGIMLHIDKPLSDEHQQWVDAEHSQAHAMLATATVRRQVARAQARASLELLAAEQTLGRFGGLAALQPEPAPAVVPATAPAAPQAGPRRTLSTLTAAVDAILADADGRTADDVEVTDRAAAAIEAARADGWAVREVYDSAIRTRRTHDAVTPRRRDVTADTVGYPPLAASAQASDAEESVYVRPDVRTEPEPKKDDDGQDERVPEPRQPSLRATVGRMVGEGLTDVEYLARALAGRYGRSTDDPTFRATVKRYVRAAQQGQDDPDTGFYM